MSQPKLTCPACGHKAMCHAGENGISICMGSLKCSCTISAASLYAAECERLSEELRDEENDHAYTVSEAKSVARESDLYLAERDAARAECERLAQIRDASASIVAIIADERDAARAECERYKAALERKIVGAIYGFAAELTSRDEPVTFSARHDAAIAADLVAQFCVDAGFSHDAINYPDHDYRTALDAGEGK